MKILLLLLMPFLAFSCEKEEPKGKKNNGSFDGGCPLVSPYSGPLNIIFTQPGTTLVYSVNDTVHLKGVVGGGTILNGGISIKKQSNDSVVFNKGLGAGYSFDEEYIVPSVTPDTLIIKVHYTQIFYSPATCTGYHTTYKSILVKIN